MGGKKEKIIKWLEEPEEHDYPAAQDYLELIFNPKKAKEIVDRLRKAPMSKKKAKDIFRASKESLLGIGNDHVESNIKKINCGEEMSPLLLVRVPDNFSVIIVDGYHRVCGVYHFDEDSVIPCKIVDLWPERKPRIPTPS